MTEDLTSSDPALGRRTPSTSIEATGDPRIAMARLALEYDSSTRSFVTEADCTSALKSSKVTGHFSIPGDNMCCPAGAITAVESCTDQGRLSTSTAPCHRPRVAAFPFT